jgi:hypothetical protein
MKTECNIRVTASVCHANSNNHDHDDEKSAASKWKYYHSNKLGSICRRKISRKRNPLWLIGSESGSE